MATYLKVVNLLVASSSIVAVAFGIQHHLAIHDPFVLVSAMIYVLVLVGLAWLPYPRKFTALLQLFLITNMFLNGFGTFSYYRTSYHYDDVVHFISPALLTYAGLAWRGIRQESLWPAIVFALFISLVWEPAEIVLDNWFGTHTYGQTNQAADTFYDIIMDLLGVATASLLYLLIPSIHIRGYRREDQYNTHNPS